MIIGSVIQWIFILGTLFFSIYILIKLGVHKEEKGFIKKAKNLFSFVVFALIWYGHYLVWSTYITHYTIIVDKGENLGLENIAIFGELEYELLNGKKITLTHVEEGNVYINNASRGVIFHSVTYGGNKEQGDLVLPSMMRFTDQYRTISLDYIVKDFDSISKSDDAGVYFYLMPLSGLPKNYKIKKLKIN